MTGSDGFGAFDERELSDFVVREARLLDERRYEEWNALFTDDAIYWVPLVPMQPEGLDHTSHLYEDKLLRELRIERLKSPRAFSQQPPTRSLHLLQAPTVEPSDPARPDERLVRTVFQYTESQGDELNTAISPDALPTKATGRSVARKPKLKYWMYASS